VKLYPEREEAKGIPSFLCTITQRGWDDGLFCSPKRKGLFLTLENYKVTRASWRLPCLLEKPDQGDQPDSFQEGRGAFKKWQPKWGKFHHIMRVTIDENGVNEGIMILPGEVSNFRRTMGKWMLSILFQPWK